MCLQAAPIRPSTKTGQCEGPAPAGHGNHTGLLQGFSVHLLRPATLARLDRQGGRFRAFLLTSLQNQGRDGIDQPARPETRRRQGAPVLGNPGRDAASKAAPVGRGDLFAALLPMVCRDPDALPRALPRPARKKFKFP